MARVTPAMRRKRRSLFTQEELGERIGYSHDTVSRMERGILPILHPALSAYLKEIGWCISFHPVYKNGKREGS